MLYLVFVFFHIFSEETATENAAETVPGSSVYKHLLSKYVLLIMICITNRIN